MNDSAIVTSGESVSIAVLANDDDADSTLLVDSTLPESETATVLIVSGPSNGTAVVQGDGTVLYTNAAGDPLIETDTFSYTLTDIDGGVSDPATVTITIEPVSNPPVAVADNAEVVSGESVSIACLLYTSPSPRDRG